MTEETKHQQLSQWTQLEQEWQTHTDLPSTRRRRKDDTVVYAKRLGKDEKLAKEAQIPFTVKVGDGGGVKSRVIWSVNVRPWSVCPWTSSMIS